MATPDHLRVKGDGEHTPLQRARHIAEVVEPVGEHIVGAAQAPSDGSPSRDTRSGESHPATN